MKKKILYTCILLTMLLTLSACGTTAAGSAEPAASSRSTGAAPEVLPPTAEELGRDASTTLIMTLEGMEEKVPATLYVGQTGDGGYSLYIPSEGWTNTQDDCWSPDVNTDVSLEIRFDGGMTAEQASAELTRSGSGYELYGFTEQEPGIYRGHDKEQSLTVQLRLAEASDGTYEIWQIYPDEAAEGFGARLGFLADTFQVN